MGCDASSLSDRPSRAEVTYRSPSPSPPKVQEVIRSLGAEPMVGTRAEFIARQEADRARFGAFIREHKITAD